MASHQQPLLNTSNNFSLSKTLWLVLSVTAILSFSALIASDLHTSTSSFFNLSLPDHHHHLCQHALHKPSCLAHVSEIAKAPSSTFTKPQSFNILQSFLINSASHIEHAMHTARFIKHRVNIPTQEYALLHCEQLMDLSLDRVWDSVMALTENSTESQQNAHAWLSSVLTNHVTCFDELDGSARALMEDELQNLISRARTSLAILVAALPSKVDYASEELNGDFPTWVRREDRSLLEAASAEAIKVDVVVAKDGSGSFKTVAEAVASAPDNGKTRYVIHVKKGTYKEIIKIGKKKTNVMLIGDGMDNTIITGSLNVEDGAAVAQTATLDVVGDGFIAQDIWFQNSAGKNHAVAVLTSSDRSVINRCRIDAFQDTLYTHSNRQFYRDSFITGTVDFIFGNSAVVFQKCKLVARRPLGNESNKMAAQGRTDPNQNTGITMQQCDIIPSPDLKSVVGSVKTYLGRPWMEYARIVVMQSFIDSHIDPAGWAPWDGSFALETSYLGEYMNTGPGAGTSKRVKWPCHHVITSAAEAMKFTVAELIQGGLWLKNTGVAYIEGL